MEEEKSVLNRAYGHMAKEVNLNLDLNFFPTFRGIKYYWYLLVRKFTR